MMDTSGPASRLNRFAGPGRQQPWQMPLHQLQQWRQQQPQQGQQDQQWGRFRQYLNQAAARPAMQGSPAAQPPPQAPEMPHGDPLGGQQQPQAPEMPHGDPLGGQPPPEMPHGDPIDSQIGQMSTGDPLPMPQMSRGDPIDSQIGQMSTGDPLPWQRRGGGFF